MALPLPSGLSPALRGLLGALGTGVLGTGVVAVFVSTNGAGTAALVAAGTGMLALAVLGDRVESLEGAGIAVKLRQEAQDRRLQAEAADEVGRHDEAERLRGSASELEAAAAELATRYESVRAARPAGGERTAELARLVQEAKEMAPAVDDPSVVAEMFRRGTEGSRIFALAAMQGDAGLADPAALADAVLHPRSAFEQYHALRAAEGAAAMGRLVDDGASTVREATRQALETGTMGAPDSDRVRLAQRVLRMLTP